MQPPFGTALVSLAEHCEVGCKFCFRAEAGRESMDVPTFMRTLSRLKEQGVSAICLTGGEPSNYSKLHSLMKLAAQFGLPCSIISAARSAEQILVLQKVNSLLAHLTISADSEEVMRLGGTTRSIGSAFETLASVNAQSSSISYTFFKLCSEEVEQLAKIYINKSSKIEFCPLILERQQLKRFDLDEVRYFEHLNNDLEILKTHMFDVSALESVVRALRAPEERQQCLARRLYIGTNGEIRKCPYRHSEVSVFHSRPEITRHLLSLKNVPFEVPLGCAGACGE